LYKSKHLEHTVFNIQLMRATTTDNTSKTKAIVDWERGSLARIWVTIAKNIMIASQIPENMAICGDHIATLRTAAPIHSEIPVTIRDHCGNLKCANPLSICSDVNVIQPNIRKPKPSIIRNIIAKICIFNPPYHFSTYYYEEYSFIFEVGTFK